MLAVFGKVLFAVFSIIIAAADIKTGKVPRLAFVIALPLFLVLALLQNETRLPMMVLAGALLGLLVFLIAFFVSGKKLGLADVWYSTLIGLVLGPWWWYAAMGCACVCGIVYILLSKRRKIPFIPLMAFGSFVMMIVAAIIDAFMRS